MWGETKGIWLSMNKLDCQGMDTLEQINSLDQNKK